MIKLVFLTALLAGCVKQESVQSLSEDAFNQPKLCLDVLQEKIHQAGCLKVRFERLGDFNIFIRCHKDDEKRGKFWDNYIFHISSIKLKYNEESQKIVDAHTICIDGTTRIEAYPPDFWENK